MGWIERTLRGTTVYARARADGSLDLGPDGRVDVRYKLDDAAKVYRAAGKNLEAPAGGPKPPVAAPSPSPSPSTAARAEAVIVYTDGACTGNPGPMGIGVVILRGGKRQEIGEYLGQGTNNIAELTAIERALDALTPADRARPVLVHVDSAYAIGVVSGAYKAKKNVELVERLRRQAAAFPHHRFVKVAGHAGVTENERCDQLATQAVARGARAI
jgi:ribonuclease HI